MSNLFTRYGVPVLAASAVAGVVYALVPRGGRIRAGQVAVITGGSRGLGLALAHRFGRAGMKLVLAARKADELETARDGLLRAGDVKHEDDVLLVTADLNDKEQCAGIIAAARNAFGRVDLLINNAGIIEVGPVENQPVAAYERAMQTNFFAALYTSQAAMPGMLAAGAGAICNICSIGGKVPVPHLLPYTAAKFALTGYSEGLHAELKYKGIRVTTVCPGLLRSGGEMHAKFVGDVEKEKVWFNLGAKTPVIAADVHHAANRIFNAVDRGQAEMTITPQAWLAARVFGMAPNVSQGVAALVNRFALPAPLPGGAAEEAGRDEEMVADPSPS